MGEFQTAEDARQGFTLEAPQQVAVREERPVRGQRRINRRNLGSFIVNGSKVSAWFERGQVVFRKRYSHRTEAASLQDIYHRAIGQSEFKL
jgi:hypothetical protein